MKIKGLAHIGIPTNDMDATRAFYEGLGFTVEYEEKNEEGAVVVTFLKKENVMLETYLSPEPALLSGAVNHFALDVDDVEEAYEALKALGYNIIEEEIQFLPFFENGTRFFNIEGPNMEIVEICTVL